MEEASWQQNNSFFADCRLIDFNPYTKDVHTKYDHIPCISLSRLYSATSSEKTIGSFSVFAR